MASAKGKKQEEAIMDQQEEEVAVKHSEVYGVISSDEYWEAQDKRDAEMRARRKADEEKVMIDLAEPFPPEMERELRKGGTTLIYIPVSEVINRLNRVFGVRGWSSEIIKCERDALDPDFIVAHVRLSIHSQNDYLMSIQKDGFGGQKIKRTKQGDIVDLGDEFKGAVSDALKKAAQQFGIGLYLARSDEALSLEIERDHASHSSAPTVDPKIASLWEKFRELSKGFDAEQKEQLGQFWSEFADGQPKPTRETVTMQGVMALIEQATKILFPGSDYTYDASE